MQNKDKARIIEASARLHLEKETEHFLSDLHGEYEAFECARRFVSGAVRRKIDALFGNEVDGGEMAAVIAFPKEKLRRMRDELGDGEYPEWLTALTERLIRLCAYVAEKQTRDTVDATLDAHAGVYADLLGELIFSHGARRKREYVGRIYSGFRRMGLEEELVVMLCSVIRALTAGRLHVIGDIYDRGPRPDLIVDAIAQEESMDLVWGNHDLLWIAASLGSEAAVFTAIANSLYYGNTELLEVGYGISLEPLATLAQELYPEIDTEIYYPKSHRHKSTYTPEIIAKMHKTAIVIREKLTADVIKDVPNSGWMIDFCSVISRENNFLFRIQPTSYATDIFRLYPARRPTFSQATSNGQSKYTARNFSLASGSRSTQSYSASAERYIAYITKIFSFTAVYLSPTPASLCPSRQATGGAAEPCSTTSTTTCGAPYAARGATMSTSRGFSGAEKIRR